MTHEVRAAVLGLAIAVAILTLVALSADDTPAPCAQPAETPHSVEHDLCAAPRPATP